MRSRDGCAARRASRRRPTARTPHELRPTGSRSRVGRVPPSPPPPGHRDGGERRRCAILLRIRLERPRPLRHETSGPAGQRKKMARTRTTRFVPAEEGRRGKRAHRGSHDMPSRHEISSGDRRRIGASRTARNLRVGRGGPRRGPAARAAVHPLSLAGTSRCAAGACGLAPRTLRGARCADAPRLRRAVAPPARDMAVPIASEGPIT